MNNNDTNGKPLNDDGTPNYNYLDRGEWWNRLRPGHSCARGVPYSATSSGPKISVGRKSYRGMASVDLERREKQKPTEAA